MRVTIIWSPEMGCWAVRLPDGEQYIVLPSDIKEGARLHASRDLFLKAKAAVTSDQAANGVHVDITMAEPTEQPNVERD